MGVRAPLAPCPLVVKNAAAATTAATNASTASPTNTWVDFRQRVRPITLLTVCTHSAESAAVRSTRVIPDATDLPRTAQIKEPTQCNST